MDHRSLLSPGEDHLDVELRRTARSSLLDDDGIRSFLSLDPTEAEFRESFDLAGEVDSSFLPVSERADPRLQQAKLSDNDEAADSASLKPARREANLPPVPRKM